MFGRITRKPRATSSATSTCGAGAHAPSGPPCTSTTVGKSGVSGVWRRGDPGLDRAALARRIEPAHLRLRVATLPRRAERGARPPARPAGAVLVKRHQLHGPGPECAEDSDRPRWGDSRGVAGGVGPGPARVAWRRGRWQDGRASLGIQAESDRMRPAAVADRGDDGACVEPERAGSSRHHPTVEVRVRPIADRSIELRSERPGPGRSVRRPEQQPRADVVEGVGLEDADRGQPAAVR